jgi:hypothetical protein
VTFRARWNWGCCLRSVSSPSTLKAEDTHDACRKYLGAWGGAGLPEAAFDDGVAAFQPGAIGLKIVFGEGAAPAQQGGSRTGGGQADHDQQGGTRAQPAGQDRPITQLGFTG